MLCSVSPGATTWTLAAGASAVRGGPTGARGGIKGAFEPMRVSGAASADAGPRRRGMTKCCPGRTVAGFVMLFASMMAATGTPYRRESVSSVSPGETTIGVPPSQVKAGGRGAAETEPVTSPPPGR